MTAIVPFRSGGKSRLPEAIRAELALAMVEDVLEVATSVASTVVVTDDLVAARLAERLGATVATDPGGGQGVAVQAALETTDGPWVVVNGDLPAATAEDVARLLEVARAGTVAVVEAADGTTNALAVPCRRAFRPLYGLRSADRFRAHALAEGFAVVDVDTPSLIDDVDTPADLDRVAGDVGPRTRRLLRLVG